MIKVILIVVGIVILVGGGYWLASRNNSTPPAVSTVPENETPVNPSVTPSDSETQIDMEKKITSAVLKTSEGSITIEFLPDLAPKTVANFIRLSQAGFYDGTKFHRVIKDFMNQGGDPLTKDDGQKARWGTGGPGYKFKDEITAQNKNNSNTVAMANSGPDTNGSQFFINVADNNFLDTKHTVFGRVTTGMDVVKAINNVPTDSSDRPIEPVIIEGITLK